MEERKEIQIINEYLEEAYLPVIRKMYQQIYVCEPFLYVHINYVGRRIVLYDWEYLQRVKGSFFVLFDISIYVLKYHGFNYNDRLDISYLRTFGFNGNEAYERAICVLNAFYDTVLKNASRNGLRLNLPPVFGKYANKYYFHDFMDHFKDKVCTTTANT